MTTLAIIGGGIAGRSLIYALAKKQKTFSKIILFDSDALSRTCSLRSTAIVAPRGISAGHSELGDLLLAAFHTFSQHVQDDQPLGVHPIRQYTAALTKLEQFRSRYPDHQEMSQFAGFEFIRPVCLTTEPAYLINPREYLEWLLKSAPDSLEVRQDFVTSVDESSQQLEIKTLNGEIFKVDQVVFAGGSYNRYWREFSYDLLARVKSVQGQYLEFSGVDLGQDSFSLTLEGDNLVYHAHSQKLLIGSTTEATHLELAQPKKLKDIYQRLQAHLKLKLPEFSSGVIQIGQREKAPKRSPYIESKGKRWWIGGYYKNGYSLGLHWANRLIQQLQ